jgi:hypothetical protein
MDRPQAIDLRGFAFPAISGVASKRKRRPNRNGNDIEIAGKSIQKITSWAENAIRNNDKWRIFIPGDGDPPAEFPGLQNSS